MNLLDELLRVALKGHGFKPCRADNIVHGCSR